MTEFPKALCLPTTDDELILRIRGFVADALDIAVEQVGADDDIYGMLNLDSLGAVAVFIDLSYVFGLPEPEKGSDLSVFNTARALASYARECERAANATE